MAEPNSAKRTKTEPKEEPEVKPEVKPEDKPGDEPNNEKDCYLHCPLKKDKNRCTFVGRNGKELYTHILVEHCGTCQRIAEVYTDPNCVVQSIRSIPPFVPDIICVGKPKFLATYIFVQECLLTLRVLVEREPFSISYDVRVLHSCVSIFRFKHSVILSVVDHKGLKRLFEHTSEDVPSIKPEDLLKVPFRNGHRPIGCTTSDKFQMSLKLL